MHLEGSPCQRGPPYAATVSVLPPSWRATRNVVATTRNAALLDDDRRVSSACLAQVWYDVLVWEILEAAMFCSQCGNAVTENARFCSRCGSAVARPASTGTGASGSRGPLPAPGNALGRESNVTLNFDAKRWGRGDVIVAATTFVLFIALFLPWFGIGIVGYGIPGLSESAVDADGWMYLVFILSLVVLGYLFARAMWGGLSLPIPHWQALVVVTGLDLLLTVICFITKPSVTTWYFGAYLGLLAALGSVVGAVIRRSEAETLPARQVTVARPVAAAAEPPRTPSSQSVASAVRIDPPTAPPVSPPRDTRAHTSVPTPLVTPAPVPPTAGPPPDSGTLKVTESSECPSCGRVNPIRNKFCNGCGCPL